MDTLPEPKERTPLELFWDELDQEEEQEGEVDALQKRDPEGSGEEEPKLCWACNRAGQVKGNCPELRDLDKSKAQRPGDDGRFKTEQLPGYKSDALRKSWYGPKAAPTTRRGVTSRPRGRYTPLRRGADSKKTTPLRRNRTYRSRRT